MTTKESIINHNTVSTIIACVTIIILYFVTKQWTAPLIGLMVLAGWHDRKRFIEKTMNVDWEKNYRELHEEAKSFDRIQERILEDNFKANDEINFLKKKIEELEVNKTMED